MMQSSSKLIILTAVTMIGLLALPSISLNSFSQTLETPEFKSKTESANQQSQQQVSELTLYEDPKGRFTLEYDPSFWIAIPDQNRFDDILVTFADKATGGDETGLTIGVMKDPLPHLSVKEGTELVLPSYIGDNAYEDKQLEEEVECQKMIVQGNNVCSFIFSQPKSYFETYPRSYLMMSNFRIGDELWIGSFTAPGNEFDILEQKVIQMINSMKIMN